MRIFSPTMSFTVRLLPYSILLLLLFVRCDSAMDALDAMSPMGTTPPEPAPPTIAIQPLGDIKQAYVDSVEDALEDYYGYEVTVLEYVPLPENAFTEIRKPRYRADTIIAWLRTEKPAEFDHVIGLTNKDISITKWKDREKGVIKDPEWKYKDFGIFGLGYRPGSSCVVSTFRLARGKRGKEKFYSRLRKITCHEIGHNLGLPHCPSENCFMRDAAESMKTIDGVEENLCNDCKSKIYLPSTP